jgi:peptidoglycan/xylan/chitin deacetylase (PgdA/CDA1 family)
LVQRTLSEGHNVGGHSFWHKWNFAFQSSNKVAEEIFITSEKIKSIVGSKPRFFRPPFGVTNPSIAKAVDKTKVVTIGWSLRSLDTVTKNPEALLSRVREVKGGDIVLFHDYCDVTLQILPRFISELKERGMKFETLEQFLDEKAYA